MKIYVVIGVWSGCIDYVEGYSDKSQAEAEVKQLKENWGIVEGHEEESLHCVYLHELEVKDKS